MTGKQDTDPALLFACANREENTRLLLKVPFSPTGNRHLNGTAKLLNSQTDMYFTLKLLAAATGLICCLLDSRTCGQDAQLAVEDMKADIATLRQIVDDSHPNPYRSVDKKEIEKRWKKAEGALRNPMSKREFFNFVAPLLNQYWDAHSAMDPPTEADFFTAYVNAGGKFFPFQVMLRGDRLYFTESLGETKIAAGSELTSINGRKTREILSELRPLAMGDNAAGRDSSLARLFSLYLWQKYLIGDRSEMIVRRPRAEKEEKVIAAGIGWDEFAKFLFAGDPVRGYELTPQIYVLEVNKMQARDSVKKEIDDIFASIKSNNYTHLVLDLRKNGGGSSVVGDWVMTYVTRRTYNQGGTKEVKISPYLSANNKFYAGWLPKLKERFPVEGDRLVMKFEGDSDTVDNEKWVFPGKVVMLTSPRTYSSGFMMAEAFKCYEMGQIVGESPGSYRNLSGEMMQFKLPKSGLIGYVAAAQFMPPCFQNEPSDFLQPDVPIEPSLSDLIAGRDTHLEYVKAMSEKDAAAAGRQ